jgi:8-oxo-dGTP pyrophosphatase MutT (NUDIX family)
LNKIISVSEALRRNPELFSKKPTDDNWFLTAKTPDGKVHEFPAGTDWKAVSRRFGMVESAVETDSNGNPQNERPRYWEADNVNIVAHGLDKKTGQVKIAMLVEERPRALHPKNHELDGSLRFGQVPMGFLGKIFGKEAAHILESAEEGAIRELGEETGIKGVRSMFRPLFPYHNPSPSFVATWSMLFFFEVDLDKIEEQKLDHDEKIFKAEFLPIPELLRRIKQGQIEDGTIYRAGTSLSILMIFFSTFPHLWPKD